MPRYLPRRLRLYAKFVVEADRNQLSVAVKDEKSIDNLMPPFALWAEIALLSTEPVVQAAPQFCDIALAAIARDTAPAEGANVAAKAAFLEAA